MCAERNDNTPHLPVLYQEIIHALRPHSPGRYVDATVGAGGHALGILQDSSPEGLLLGLDLDPQALEIASRRLSAFESRVTLRQVSYTTLQRQLADLGWNAVDGIVIDLGVSSMQIDTPERGFSFLADGPLDMRFSPDQPTSAADLINTLPETELADLIYRYGEERASRRIARAIVQARPLHTTAQLAEVILRASGGRRGRIHPATRTFQALRIAVNHELDALEEFLPQAVQSLAPGGRLAVISFHSLEDRIVKQYFRLESRDCICPPDQPVCTCGHKASLVEVNRHPIEATAEEASRNPRARSAKLRIVEKLPLA
ncbi:16S rRNA (cytosine(1402)-N(4))-methyltransferase [Longilinea arvoryzae]|uniref:Ribosomal RNA small subunit methyltransferase H n=1 Tax=Longilinea arvoryzae TaxID=360412 RepID=A0A0S7B9S5_9CHLR|nr:16S rRNA (cytosine(1402)-N(4))-methyltransferase RsmH [Longilinea arvoryzae]GAP14284.1 16S rRNA (cytosine(1402)-N(4))-methyltransferase [Longilinea arvoryzae]